MLLQLVIHGVNIVASIGLVYGLGWGVPGVALGTVLGQAVSAGLGLAILVRHFGGMAKIAGLIAPAALFDTAALRRMFGLSRDLMIRSIALMCAYGWFAAQGSRMGEVALGANAILLNFLMISGFFLDGIAQAAEQLCGKAVGANWKPAFDRAYALSFRWGVVIAAGLALFWLAGGWLLIDLMTTNEPVRAHARAFLLLAALAPLTCMPPFLFDGILTGATMNDVMRNGMLVALAVFLAAALILQPAFGNTGLWLSLHIFFLARAAIYWRALHHRRAALFSAGAASGP